MAKIKKSIMLILIIALMSVIVGTGAGAETVTLTGIEDDEGSRTITELNELRSIYNLPLLAYNNELKEAAYYHNQYMNYNEIYSSIEESEKLYYRGRYPWDRAAYAGYEDSYVFEALVKDVQTFSSGISHLLNNPYARFALLDPLYSDAGMDAYNGYNTFLFGGGSRDNDYEVIYPYNGQEDVAANFRNYYVIDPYNMISETAESKGIPITYSIYSDNAAIQSINDIDVELINTRTNEEVEVKVITSISDRNLKNTIAVLPLSAYDYGTTYEISILARIRFDEPVNINTSSYWKYVSYRGTFSTIQAADTMEKPAYITRAEFVEDIIKANPYVIQDSLEIIFPDVNINSPSYKYIYTAYVHKIILGYADGLYRPDANISREQAYTILIRTYEDQYESITLNQEDRSLAFSDKNVISFYALEPLYKAKKIGLLIDNPYEFNSKDYITSSELSYLLSKYDSITNNQ